MPELCRFDGITIFVRWSDHNPPHFHAKHGGSEVEIIIRTVTVRRGRLPGREARKVLRWATEHQVELMAAWDDVSAERLHSKIAPPFTATFAV